MTSKVIFIKWLGYFIILLLACIGCKRNDEIDLKLNLAEKLMELYPDSSLLLLNSIDDVRLDGARRKARFALLKTAALDKNYIDTTTFDILRPALNYYLKLGTNNEKAKTYYYEGVIHSNGGNDDLAMDSYLTALEFKENMTDTLTLAKILVAQGTLMSKQYRVEECLNNNLKSANLYKAIGKRKEVLRCYMRALDGAIILNDRLMADSIVSLYEEENRVACSSNQMPISLFAYYLKFGRPTDIREMIGEVKEYNSHDDIGIIMAQAYIRLGEPEKSLQFLNKVEVASDDILDSLTFWSVSSEIMEALDRDKDALESYRNYSRLLEDYHMRLFSSELLFSEKKHQMELESMAKIRKRDNAIKWILAGTAIILLLTLLTYYRYRMNKAARAIAEESTAKLQLKAENLELETENLHLQISHLEDERERLESLLDKHDQLSAEMRRIIRKRLDMLNGLFASEITNQESYAKDYKDYVMGISKNKNKFMHEIRTDLETTNPEFLAYLNKLGLTEMEIDYVCLYSIGLRGKEIGVYLEASRHYIVSSEIRRKFGLVSKDENLGPFIRKLLRENKKKP